MSWIFLKFLQGVSIYFHRVWLAFPDDRTAKVIIIDRNIQDLWLYQWCPSEFFRSPQMWQMKLVTRHFYDIALNFSNLANHVHINFKKFTSLANSLSKLYDL